MFVLKDSVNRHLEQIFRFHCELDSTTVRRCGVLGSILAFGSIGHGFESELRLFSQQSASAFSNLRSLAKCSLDDSVRRLL